MNPNERSAGVGAGYFPSLRFFRWDQIEKRNSEKRSQNQAALFCFEFVLEFFGPELLSAPSLLPYISTIPPSPTIPPIPTLNPHTHARDSPLLSQLSTITSRRRGRHRRRRGRGAHHGVLVRHEALRAAEEGVDDQPQIGDDIEAVFEGFVLHRGLVDEQLPPALVEGADDLFCFGCV